MSKIIKNPHIPIKKGKKAKSILFPKADSNKSMQEIHNEFEESGAKNESFIDLFNSHNYEHFNQKELAEKAQKEGFTTSSYIDDDGDEILTFEKGDKAIVINYSDERIYLNEF